MCDGADCVGDIACGELALTCVGSIESNRSRK